MLSLKDDIRSWHNLSLSQARARLREPASGFLRVFCFPVATFENPHSRDTAMNLLRESDKPKNIAVRGPNPESYKQLCRELLRGDGWRRQSRDSMDDVEIHHKAFRSQSGGD